MRHNNRSQKENLHIKIQQVLVKGGYVQVKEVLKGAKVAEEGQ